MPGGGGTIHFVPGDMTYLPCITPLVLICFSLASFFLSNNHSHTQLFRYGVYLEVMLCVCCFHPALLHIASHAGVFRGARIRIRILGREEIRAPLKTPAWEAILHTAL